MYTVCGCYCVVSVRCSFVVACCLLFDVRWLFLVVVLCYAVFSDSSFVVFVYCCLLCMVC